MLVHYSLGLLPHAVVMNGIFRALCILSLMAQVGCGSNATVASSFDAADRFADLSGRFVGNDPSDPRGLPVTGVLDYDGIARVVIPIRGNPGAFYGTLTLTIDLGRLAGGFAGEIVDLAGDLGQLSGQITISGGRLDRSVDPDDDYTYSAQLDGQLALDGLEIDLAGVLHGDFLGRFQDGAAGVINGTVSIDGISDIFDGAFVAEQVRN